MDKILTFIDRQAFREWLGKNGTESDGIWLNGKNHGKRKGCYYHRFLL